MKRSIKHRPQHLKQFFPRLKCRHKGRQVPNSHTTRKTTDHAMKNNIKITIAIYGTCSSASKSLIFTVVIAAIVLFVDTLHCQQLAKKSHCKQSIQDPAMLLLEPHLHNSLFPPPPPPPKKETEHCKVNVAM